MHYGTSIGFGCLHCQCRDTSLEKVSSYVRAVFISLISIYLFFYFFVTVPELPDWEICYFQLDLELLGCFLAQKNPHLVE